MGKKLIFGLALASACVNPATIDQEPMDPPVCEQPLPAHSCYQIPCLSFDDCTPRTAARPPVCKCPLPIGTPMFVTECYLP